MNTNETNTNGTTTLYQRLVARLVDASPARYSAPIGLRTFGRVKLADSIATFGALGTPAAARVTRKDSASACVRPRTAA